MRTATIHNIINLRGIREQSFKFAFNEKGGMKQCYTRGCEIFAPLQHALKNIDLSEALLIDRYYRGEEKINWKTI